MLLVVAERDVKDRSLATLAVMVYALLSPALFLEMVVTEDEIKDLKSSTPKTKKRGLD